MAKELICTQCGSVGKIKSETKGSIIIELILWLCFLVPGLIYSFWRLSNKSMVCKECGSSNLIPVDSPLGKKKMEEYHTEIK